MASSKAPPDLSDEEEWEAFDNIEKNQNISKINDKKNEPKPLQTDESDSKTDNESKSCKRGLKSSLTDESDAPSGNENKVYKPEPSDAELLIKPACECRQCRHWTTSVDWCTTPNLEFEDQHKKVCKDKKAEPLLKTDKDSGKIPKICSFDSYHSNNIEKLSEFKTLVQGEIIPQPVKQLSDTHFHKNIYSTLEKLNYRYSLPVQSFVWPAIFRQLNVFMISGHKSGKTMAYLPAICSFGFQEDAKYQEFSKYKGPLIVIVCPNSKQCEEIFDLIKKLYGNVHIKPKVSIMTYPVPNTNNTDILITIPDSLVYCLKSRIFNLKRLCHIVFENMSWMLKNNEESIYRILNVANEMLAHRNNTTKVQLIVSSEKWTTDMKKLLKSINMTPLVCIGNYLEAALYGGIQFEVKFLMSDQKNAYIEGILKNHSHMYKTLIICNDSDIVEVNKWLVRNGIETMALADKATKEDIDECEILWKTLPSGHYKVLLCTDFIFDTLLTIKDAMWLIHYSFPHTWTRFSKRFSASSAHYKSPLVEDDKKTKIKCKSYILIDETCEKAMPKLLNLLSRLTKDLPVNYQQYVEGFKMENENKKIEEGVELCEDVKLFGKCSDSLCKRRHLLTEKLDVSDNLPKNGKIVFKILAIKDVTQYVIQLREHIDLDGHVRKINDADLKKPLVYTDKTLATDIEVGKFYVHCDNSTDGEIFMLCQLLKIENETFVEVKLTTGVTLQTLHTKLYELPSDLEILEVYMCNLIPPFKDEYFSGRSYHITRTSFETIEYKNIVFTADVYLQLDKTIWVDNVVEIAKVSDSEIIKFNLTKHLLGLKVVELNKTQLSALYKLCEKCEIALPCYAKSQVKKPLKEKQIEPQRAFLNENPTEIILSSAISPAEFYVRLSKYQDLLENLQKDIQKLVKNEVLDKNVNVAVGKYYLALDPVGDAYARVMVLQIENKKALCFYVDYGDEAIKHISELKKLPSKYITRLPFQAIQCRLHGLTPSFDEWENEATDVLYKYMFEPQSDFFRSLFVKVCDTEKSDTIRTKVKYSVLLKDGYDSKHILINQLLIDCGFATSIFGTIDDFELPALEPKKESSDSNSDSDDADFDPVTDEDYAKENEVTMGDEDLEIFNEDDFLELFSPFELKRNDRNPAIQYETPRDEGQSTIVEPNTSNEANETEENSKYLTPEVYWSQNEKTVTMKIQLIGVEQYQVNVIRKRIFTFSTNLDNKSYKLKFTLHKLAELEKHSAKGQDVQVVLNKVEPLEWLQLTGTNKRLRNIHYEVTEEKEKAKRKFLQLDITDDESDSDDNVMYEVISDLDSEFDNEAYSSSSE